MCDSVNKSKVKGKVIRSQTREVISNVLTFMEREAEEGKFIIQCKRVHERVAAAVGVSVRTLSRIKSERKRTSESGTSFETPNKKRLRCRPITGLDDFDQCVVRRIINNFYLLEKCLPTIPKIRTTLEREINFQGSASSVGRIIKKLGYKWKKTNSNKRILMERQEISYCRFIYLSKLNKYRTEGRPIVYTDETYIHSTHSSSKGWSDDSTSGVAVPISKGKRLIIVHAGGEMGFINNCLTMWKSGQSTGDYHHEMNHNNYVKWVQNKLIPNLPGNSVIVVDNASYHNVQKNKPPSISSTKAEMQSWLRNKNIYFSETMLKVQLYELIKSHKPQHKEFVIDELLGKHGHSVLRLPPYHPELNPIELIWAEIKNWVGAHNVTFKMEDVIRLTEAKIQQIGQQEWVNKCEHSKKIEIEFLKQQGPVENTIESFVIQLGGGQTDDETDSSDSSAISDTSLSGIEEL